MARSIDGANLHMYLLIYIISLIIHFKLNFPNIGIIFYLFRNNFLVGSFNWLLFKFSLRDFVLLFHLSQSFSWFCFIFSLDTK